MTCQFVKSSGERCNAKALAQHVFCFSHEPSAAEQKHEAVLKGGQALKRHTHCLPPVRLETIEDAKGLIAMTINEVRGGEIDIKVANCIGFLTNHFVRAYELSDLQKRIDIVEKALETK